MRSLTLPKAIRLVSKKEIESLFQKGKSTSFFPLRLIHLNPLDERSPVEGESRSYRVLFSVPSRRFRKATIRNRIKRLMREAFRLEQQLLANCTPLHIAYIYIAPEQLPLKEIRSKMMESMRLLAKIHAKN